MMFRGVSRMVHDINGLPPVAPTFWLWWANPRPTVLHCHKGSWTWARWATNTLKVEPDGSLVSHRLGWCQACLKETGSGAVSYLGPDQRIEPPERRQTW